MAGLYLQSKLLYFLRGEILSVIVYPKYSEIYLVICTFYSIVAGKINGIYVGSATITLKICEGPQRN